MPYSLGMGASWLEFEDAGETHRVPLVGVMTRIGGEAPDVSVAGLPEGELHLWSDPPKIVLVAGSAELLVNGRSGEGGLLAGGDLIEWGGTRFRYGHEEVSALLESVELLGAAAAPLAPVEAGGGAWDRVRAGMMVDLGMANRGTVKRWQDAVLRGDFAPDACARDIQADLSVDGDDPRLVERSGRLLKDFLMASMMTGVGGVKRRARQAGKKGAAIFISQAIFLSLYTLVLMVALLLLHKWDSGFLTGIFNKILSG